MASLWRLTWSHALGVYWLHCRGVDETTGEQWKRIYESDDKGALYTIAEKRPSLPDNAETLARHIAAF